MENNRNSWVISLGGSIMAPPSGIDRDFLSRFQDIIVRTVHPGDEPETKNILIVVGGGAVCREYQAAARQVMNEVASDDLDWLGIHVTRLNAYLLKTLFGDSAYPEIVTDPTLDIPSEYRLVIAAGWRPGWSTDYVAVTLAEKHGADIVINLTDIDYVYDKDPKQFKDAQKVPALTWAAFRELVGGKWEPGRHAPFDPIASKKAEELGLKVVIMNGRNLNNLDAYLTGGELVGTLIGG